MVSSSHPSSAIITLVVGNEHRLFAAHEDVLCASPFFQAALHQNITDGGTRRIALPDEEPEIFSSVLEFLYKGDYYPRLMHSKRRNSWELEPADADRPVESTVYHHSVDGELLKDTVIYCAGEKYGLEELKKISLRKQGLRKFDKKPLTISLRVSQRQLFLTRATESGIQCSTILASARYAYANTPDSDSKLRAHYLALIIRSRSTFKRSGTMQLEMWNGGTPLFFDLFVALCNHVDDISAS